MADIRHAIQIAASPEQIYGLVSNGSGFERWWAKDVTERSGAVELGFFNRTTVYRLRLAGGKPPDQVEWKCETGDEWQDTTLGFRMEPSKTGTLLRFTHGGWRGESDYFTSCNTTWGELMFRLKAAAEGKSPGPLFSAGDMSY